MKKWFFVIFLLTALVIIFIDTKLHFTFYLKNSFANKTNTTPNFRLRPMSESIVNLESGHYAIVVHGLNQHPNQMQDLVELLNSFGVNTIQVALDGHRGNFDELTKVSSSNWQQNISQAHNRYLELVRNTKTKSCLYYIGNSLGGLLGVEYSLMNNNPFCKMILFAPALSVHFPDWPVRILNTVFPNLSFPSGIPSDIRANDRGTIAANKATFDSLFNLSKFQKNQWPKQVLVFGNSADEVVNIPEVKMISENNHWSYIEINISDSTRKPGIAHNISTRESVGDIEWRKIQSRIQAHLFER